MTRVRMMMGCVEHSNWKILLKAEVRSIMWDDYDDKRAAGYRSRCQWKRDEHLEESLFGKASCRHEDFVGCWEC